MSGRKSASVRPVKPDNGASAFGSAHIIGYADIFKDILSKVSVIDAYSKR